MRLASLYSAACCFLGLMSTVCIAGGLGSIIVSKAVIDKGIAYKYKFSDPNDRLTYIAFGYDCSSGFYHLDMGDNGFEKLPFRYDPKEAYVPTGEFYDATVRVLTGASGQDHAIQLAGNVIPEGISEVEYTLYTAKSNDGFMTSIPICVAGLGIERQTMIPVKNDSEWEEVDSYFNADQASEKCMKEFPKMGDDIKLSTSSCSNSIRLISKRYRTVLLNCLLVERWYFRKTVVLPENSAKGIDKKAHEGILKFLRKKHEFDNKIQEKVSRTYDKKYSNLQKQYKKLKKFADKAQEKCGSKDT